MDQQYFSILTSIILKTDEVFYIESVYLSIDFAGFLNIIREIILVKELPC